jgi:hypothetical protein
MVRLLVVNDLAGLCLEGGKGKGKAMPETGRGGP